MRNPSDSHPHRRNRSRLFCAAMAGEWAGGSDWKTAADKLIAMMNRGDLHSDLREFCEIMQKMGNTLDNRIIEQENMKGRLSTVEAKVTHAHTPTGNANKPILESKTVSGIKAFTGDKTNFREWHEKLVIGLTQVIPEAREAMAKIEKVANEKQDLETMRTQWEANYGGHARLNYFKFANDLWCILVDKCEG